MSFCFLDLDLDTQTKFASRNIIFQEEDFPFATLIPNSSTSVYNTEIYPAVFDDYNAEFVLFQIWSL